MTQLLVHGKQVIFTEHALWRAKTRGIGLPDQLEAVLLQGKLQRFGKRGCRFSKRSKRGTIICIGEELSTAYVIKTVERGN